MQVPKAFPDGPPSGRGRRTKGGRGCRELPVGETRALPGLIDLRHPPEASVRAPLLLMRRQGSVEWLLEQ